MGGVGGDAGRGRRGVKVLLVEPLPTVRTGLTLLLESASVDVLDGVDSADACLSRLRALRRRVGVVVLVGLRLKGEQDAFWLIENVRREFPALRVLALGAQAAPIAISRCLFVGADGFLDEQCEPEVFVSSLRAAASGEMILAGVDDNDLFRIARTVERQKSSDFVLSAREQEVLTVAAEGLTARQIGSRLGLCERTVTTHLSRIYGKLGVNGRVGAIGEAAKRGLVSVN
jgi:DNA-binding NarL/FixJ family response regulator